MDMGKIFFWGILAVVGITAYDYVKKGKES